MTPAHSGDDANMAVGATPAASRPESLTGAETTPPPPGGSRAAHPRSSGDMPEGGPLPLGQAFGPRYRITRLLGVGGMGAVYEAWDAELGVSVAIKVIRPETTADAVAAAVVEQRFKRELLLAREVTHKNVVRIHDLGEIDGVKYITMSYVDGENLAGVLRARGTLPIKEALAITRQIAAGLRAAHEAGIVHRDLKPANVMIDGGGHALIMDFGIARLESAGAPLDSVVTPAKRSDALARRLSGYTMDGAVVGTLDYMAPEQARGQALDHRADIYAFGLILRDMLVGPRPGGDPMGALRDRMEKGLPALRSIDASIPDTLEQIASRCLQVDPGARYQTTAELCAVLDRLDDDGQRMPEPRRLTWRLAVAGLLVVSAVTSGVVWLTRPAPPPPQHEPFAVLVSDFVNKTGDPVFDGVLEQPLGIGIEASSFIVSFPRRDALRAARRIKPGATGIDEQAARLIAQREAIKLVLAGSIERAGSGFEVSVRVLDPVPGKQLARLSARAAGKADVLRAVGTVAARTRGVLGDTVTETEGAAARETFTAASIEAANSYAAAQALANVNKDEDAIVAYKRAIELDPNFGRAYSGWAASAIKLGRKDEADQMYQKALALVDRMTEREKYRTFGAYYLNVAGNYEKAIENFEALVRKFPSDGAGHNNLAIAYFGTLNFTKALEEGRHVLGIYPNSPLYRSNYALYAMYAGDFATAATEGRKMADTGDFLAYLPVAMAALAENNVADAAKAWEEARATGTQGVSLASIGLADMALAQWRGREAAAVLQQGLAVDLGDKNQMGAAAKEVAMAEAQWQQGRRKEALAAVARALKGSRDLYVIVPAARVLLDAGQTAEVETLAEELGRRLQTRDQACADLLKAQLALTRGQPAEALNMVREALKHADLWLIRFTLGVAYVQAGAFAEALTELELCEKRRGETTALFLNDLPTYRFAVPLSYWLGRAQEGLGMREAANRSYQAYLAFRPESSGDSLAKDAQKRRLATGS